MQQVIRAGLPKVMLQVVEEKAWAARERRANGLMIEAGEECRRSQRTKMTLLGRYHELEMNVGVAAPVRNQSIHGVMIKRNFYEGTRPSDIYNITPLWIFLLLKIHVHSLGLSHLCCRLQVHRGLRAFVACSP